MAWAIVTIYTFKCAQMDPQQLPGTSKFYSRCKKCDIEKTLWGWVPSLLGSPKGKTPKHHHIIPILKKLHWLKIPERVEYNAILLTYNTLQSSQPSYLHVRQLFTIQPPRPTRSYSALTPLRPSVTSSLKSADRSIVIAAPPLWNKLLPVLRQLSDPSTKTSPLAISPQLFHSKLKHCSSTNPSLIHPLLPTSIPPSTLNTMHHSGLSV